MNEKNSQYAIFTNKNTKRKLVYYPVAKNANSSAKLFLLKHIKADDKFFFLSDKVPEYLLKTEKKYKDIDWRYNLVNFLPNYNPFSKIDVDEKCCIVRDPIERFISSYKNRILFHKDSGFKNHNIDEIIEKLENNMFENKHFLPQTYWLGNNLKFFTIVANVKNLKSFVDGVNNFFQNKIEFPKIQIGGNKERIKLNQNQIKKLKKIYLSDYELIGDYC